jgi:hypothetical protein
MREKIAEMRGQLIQALDSHFQLELDRSIQHINETISPYTRFVRAERTKNLDARSSLEDIQNEISRLHSRIDDLS